jgi:AsmA protein
MKRVAIIAGCVIGLLLVAALALPFLIDPNSFRPMLQDKLSEALAREVKLGDLKLSILSGSVTASDLSIADDPAYSRTPFVQAKALSVGVELWPLITSRQLHVTGLTIDHPTISLVQSDSGLWNFSSLGGKSVKAAEKAPPRAPSSNANLDLSVNLVTIVSGQFSLGRIPGHRKPLVLEDVNVAVHDFSATTAFPFTLDAKVAGGGTIKIDGRAGPVDAEDAAASPFTVNLNLNQVDLVGSGLSQMVPSVSGVISVAANCSSDGKSAQVKGKITADRMRLSKTGTAAKRSVAFDFATSGSLKKHSGRLERGDIHIGSDLARLTGTFAEQGDTVAVHMTLDGPKMAVTELAEMLPPLGIVLPGGSSLQGGTATVKLTMDGPADKLVTAGLISFDNAKLSGFDLGKKMSTIERLAGIKAGPDTEIEKLASNLKMGPEGIAMEAIQVVVTGVGGLNGAGTVSAANELDFKMSATVQTSGVAAVIRDAPIPFTVTGTANEPVFRPDVKAVVKEEAGKAVGVAGSLLKGLLGGKK